MLVEDGLFLDESHDLYEQLVPKNHKLRKILELTDFGFIYDELKGNYCIDNGRHATSPIMLYKYLILKIIYKLSDSDLVERTRYDLSFKYFLGMHPMNTELIHPATLTKFRRNRLKDSNLLRLTLAESVKIAKAQIDMNSQTTLIMDATHTNSRFNTKSQREILIEESKLLRKAIYAFDENMKEKFPRKATSGLIEDHINYCKELIKIIESDERFELYPAVQEKLSYLKEIIDDNLEHLKTSFDEDAKIGHKTHDSNFFGYKTHIAITENRIITAATVTTGEKHDGKELIELVEMSKENGIEVNEIIADGAYSESDNLDYTKSEEIKLVSKLSKAVVESNNHKVKGFYFNKDAGMYVCPEGHISIKKAKTGRKDEKKGKYQSVETYYFDVEKCKVCPKRNGCYKEGAKTRTYSVTIKKENFKEQMKFMKTEEFKNRSKERYKIEAINAHLKNDYQYRTSNSRGLFGMEVQAATTIFVSNLERIIKLINEKSKEKEQ
jgi:hypothetical protein